MNAVAQVAAIIAALTYIVASPMEMFFYEKTWARKFLHVETHNLEDVRLWAFAVGARNLLAGVGVIIGIVILQTGNEVVGSVVVLTVCWYMLLASLAMGVSDLLGLWRPRGGSVNGTVGSSLFPLIAIIASAF